LSERSDIYPKQWYFKRERVVFQNHYSNHYFWSWKAHNSIQIFFSFQNIFLLQLFLSKRKLNKCKFCSWHKAELCLWPKACFEHVCLKTTDGKFWRFPINLNKNSKENTIVLSHYDVTSKQIYCSNAKNHGRLRGYSNFKLIKNSLKDYL